MNFIDPQLLPLTTLDKSYNPYLVVLSVLIAIVSSFTAFSISERMRASPDRWQQLFWDIFGAITLGIGIWAMHFIGSLALQLPIPVSYNLKITLLSVLPAILTSSVVLWLMKQNQFSLSRLIFCGLLMGIGIGSMHYTGMAAMTMNAQMLFLKLPFVLSIAVAVIFSTMALKINYEANNKINYQFIDKKQAYSALVMGMSISLMHYTAMKAVVFVPMQSLNHFDAGINTNILSFIISLVVILAVTVATLVPHLLRFKQMVYSLQKNEESLQIAAIAFQTHEGIMVTDNNARILRVNNAFTRITGYTEDEIIGKNPRLLKSDKHDVNFYKRCWNSIANEGKWSGEIWNRRKNGEIFLEWQTILAVKNDDDYVTHYISFYSDITEFKVAEKEIEKLAFYDALTDLPNRRLLYQRLEHELNIARRYQRAGILLFLDLDRFKLINDSLGHSVGDKLLIETARRLQSLLRNTDTAVRLGGDEFIILTNAQDGIHTDLLEQSNVIAKKIIAVINQPYMIDDNELFISTSIGITLFTGIDETVDLLLTRADTAMYQAKDAGRNTFRFYQKSMQEAADERLKIERNLRNALKKEELSLHFQPQLSEDNEIIGAEALIRWNSEELGFIPPNDFISIAEETGLIIPIGQWIIEKTCQQINCWDDQKVVIPHIAINISAKQFHQADFVSTLIHTILENKVKAERIVLEITESVFLGNVEEVVDKMNALKKNGFLFSIDDFGTGYSSLTYLKSLPFDQLKIDQAFIRDMIDHPSDLAIVKAIIVMAKGLNLDLIAEGVETKQHLACLSDFGCHNFQGYFFSKPLKADDLSEYVKHHYSEQREV